MVLPLIFCVVAEIKQKKLRGDARERLQEINLNTIVLSAHEFEWTEAGREISIRGELFDVKSYSFKKGRFIFNGLFDKEDTALDKIEHDWKDNRDENKVLTGLFQVLQSVFYNTVSDHNLYFKLANHYPYLNPDKLSLQPKDVATPPPQAQLLLIIKKSI